MIAWSACKKDSNDDRKGDGDDITYGCQGLTERADKMTNAMNAHIADPTNRSKCQLYVESVLEFGEFVIKCPHLLTDEQRDELEDNLEEAREEDYCD